MKSFLATLALSLPLQAFASGYSFTPLFDSHEHDYPFVIIPFGISHDGTKVSGNAHGWPIVSYDFLWDSSSGITNLGSPPVEYTSLSETTISGDGYTVLLNTNGSHVVTDDSSYHATRWDAVSGHRNILNNELVPNKIYQRYSSYNGQFIAGWEVQRILFNDLTQAVRINDGEVEYLGNLSETNAYSEAYGISSDGQTIVGRSRNDGGNIEAFIWTPNTGMIGLGVIEGFEESAAVNISSSGYYVTGHLYELGDTTTPKGGFLWSSKDGMAHIRLPEHQTAIRIVSVSDDGRIFGTIDGLGGFIWDRIRGFRYLRIILETNGVDLLGWTLMGITDVTPDGQTLIGYGWTPDDRIDAFIATLPSDCDDESTQAPRQIWGVAFLPVGEPSGWLNEWIGYVYYHPDYYPWSFCYGLDWLYTYGNCDGGAWFWSPVADWLYTAPALYPYLYSTKAEKWLYHQRNTEELYDFSTETTLRLQDL